MFTVRHRDPEYTGRVIVDGLDLDFIDGTAKVSEMNAAQQTVLTAVKRWGVTREAPPLPKEAVKSAPATAPTPSAKEK